MVCRRNSSAQQVDALVVDDGSGAMFCGDVFGGDQGRVLVGGWDEEQIGWTQPAAATRPGAVPTTIPAPGSHSRPSQHEEKGQRRR